MFLDLAISDFFAFLLILFRIAGLMLTAPFLGARNIPPQVQIGFSLILALLIFPTVPRAGFVLPENLGVFVVAVLSEMGIGAIIGFVASLFFAAVQSAGMIVDQELGFSLANVLDPVSNEQVSIIGHLKNILALLVFLGINGHHLLLEALTRSFSVVPLMGLRFSKVLQNLVTVHAAGALFEIAVQLAAPVLVAVFLATVALALVARTVPEMNVFIMGFSIRIAVGFVVLLMFVPIFAHIFVQLTGRMGTEINALTDAMR
ncbi:MAG: flagellar biosynthetic protein FliR [Planctomycetota bacterium]|nr:flagellar biosynthetic protein FliR [Planctomycetota bacterium]